MKPKVSSLIRCVASLVHVPSLSRSFHTQITSLIFSKSQPFHQYRFSSRAFPHIRNHRLLHSRPIYRVMWHVSSIFLLFFIYRISTTSRLDNLEQSANNLLKTSMITCSSISKTGVSLGFSANLEPSSSFRPADVPLVDVISLLCVIFNLNNYNENGKTDKKKPFTLIDIQKLVHKCRGIGDVGQTGILGIGASSSDSSQWGNSTDVGNMGQSGAATKRILVDGVGDSVVRNSDLFKRMEHSFSSFGQPRKRILDSTFITGIVEPIRGHPYIPLLSITSDYATSSAKKLRANSHQHNGNSLSLSERLMHTNDRPTRPGGARIPVNDSTAHIHCSGPLSSKRSRACSYEDGGNSYGSIEHRMRTNDSSSALVKARMSIKNFTVHVNPSGHYKHDGNSLGRDERLMRTDHCRSASVDAEIPINNSPAHTHCSGSLSSDSPFVDGHGGNSSTVGQQSMRTNDDPNISVGAGTTTKDYSAAIYRSGAVHFTFF
uniref:Uncharacterized protein n=1 Tax=Tanacetum cinerariifolium TaxID=118510 RepID=A0A6L2M993_TANCI|nr:hypothetical protein [Tanacetum cinerariifolium]